MPETGVSGYRRPSSPPHRHPVAGHLLTIREAIDAGHPDEDVLSSIEALADDPNGCDDAQTELRTRLIATAADVAQGWFDNAGERVLGDAADVAFGKAHDQ